VWKSVLWGKKRTWTSLVLVAVALLLVACDGLGKGESSAEPTPFPPVRTREEVVAEGRVVPLRDVQLAFGVPGRVVFVGAKEGQVVEAGAVLARLDDGATQAQLRQAEAALAAARAALARLEMGARPEEVAVAESAVEAAQAQVAIARAQAEAADRAVDQANAQVKQADAAFADLKAGATQEELEAAKAAVRQAENALWAAQAERDAIGGAVDRKEAKDYHLDQAEANVGVAYEALQMARWQLAQLEAGPRPGALAQAQAAVESARAGKDAAEAQAAVAQAQVKSAEAALAQAQAQLALVQAAATKPDLDAARAAVQEAEAAVAQAKLALDELVLRAPFTGTVVWLDVEVGERVSPNVPVARLADLSGWEIETTDLAETDVVRIAVGQTVTITPDALPDLHLSGEVTRIDELYREKLGDVVYTAHIRLVKEHPQLRWGMTVEVLFGS